MEDADALSMESIVLVCSDVDLVLAKAEGMRSTVMAKLDIPDDSPGMAVMQGSFGSSLDSLRDSLEAMRNSIAEELAERWN